MKQPPQLPPAIRAAAAAHHTARLEWETAHPPINRAPRRGDLVTVNNGEGGHGIVLVVTEHDTHLNVLWTHTIVDQAYDADIILPRTPPPCGPS